MKAIIVGSGPVGCLFGLGLRRRGFDVTIYEKVGDPRHSSIESRRSFNLTLSSRGMRALDSDSVATLEAAGRRLFERVIHDARGGVVHQPYGYLDDHYLLSVPRSALHAHLLDKAEQSGVRLEFGAECVEADTANASAVFRTTAVTRTDCGDLLVGADGASSVIRRDMASRGVTTVMQDRSQYGYVDLRIPALSTALDGGMHIWPRGDFMLTAQPNVDGTHTATLFLPLTANGRGAWSFDRMSQGDTAERFLEQYFPDLTALFPELSQQLGDARAASLKTVRCSRLNHEHTVLVGDAAHTMLPFYGQGINCSFEDVRVFLEMLDRNSSGGRPAIPATLDRFTLSRQRPIEAIIDLSSRNLHELCAAVGEPGYQAKARIERELARRYPESFLPLYCGVAFSTTPYDALMALHQRQQAQLTQLYDRFDPVTDGDQIIRAYPRVREQGGSRSAMNDLELSIPEQAEMLDLITSRIIGHYAAIGDGQYPPSYVHDSIDISRYQAGRQLSEALREPQMPIDGSPLEPLLAEIFDRASPAGTLHPHPGFMAHVPSGGLLQGAAGSFIGAALNRFPGVWVAAPGLIELECNVIRWYCRMLGYGDQAFGYLTTSGSLANMMGLMCACRRGDDDRWARQAVYTSSEGHYSVRKAARLIGVAPSCIRTIAARGDYTFDVATLAARIENDKRQGLVPACVVATAGTTNSGAIDPLPELAALCREQQIWFHVDACFGGFFRITERGSRALTGIEEADSIAVDAHKSLFLPHGNSALVVKDRRALSDTFAVSDAPYLPGGADFDGLVDFCQYGPELSREFRGLAPWLALKRHGVQAFERCLDERLDLANLLADKLGRIREIEVIDRHPRHLPVVVFRRRPTRPEDASEDAQALCRRICERGHVYLTTTELPDYGHVIRACILNHRTTVQTVDALVADVVATVNKE